MYMVFDDETENHEKHRRFANPFVPDNWVIMRGWKKQGDKQCSHSYHPKPDGHKLFVPDDVTMLVGHNIKFDLLYEWESPSLKAFFKRGGRVWDTMYAEYLIQGMRPEAHMLAMDDIVEKYGGRKKIDAVKQLWDEGYLTSEIDPDMLLDYLIGTKEEKRDSGDIGNTEKIFLGQVVKAKELGMMKMILARMDGLCCTTEMEYNGLKIDVKEAKRRMQIMEKELAAVEEKLYSFIPPMPEQFTFNWGSKHHVSCLVFGGTLKYKAKSTYIDEATGELARYKAIEAWPLVDGIPVSPTQFEEEQLQQDRFTSGKKKGDLKFKNVRVEGELKEKYIVFKFDLPGYAVPKPEWAMELEDADGAKLYSTNAEIIEELAATQDIPFLRVMLERQNLVKDLSTYYLRFDEKKQEYVGMLTCVMPKTHIIHHNLNHVATVTSRLSSNKPNLQNIPRGDTSEVKKMFISRFLNGSMLESDYSQLEVVVQGLLSLDINLCKDLRDKVDFHCKRVSYKYKVTYDEALYRCKDSSYPDHKTWKLYRTKCKEFSFQRAYGAGAPKIALTTGMAIEDVKELIEAEDIMYPGVAFFNDRVAKAVNASAKPFRDFSRGGRMFRRGWWQSPTGTLYSFRTYDAPDYLQKRGIKDSFMPTELKNYPIQGTGGEIVQIVLGRLWRHFVKNDNYNGRALLCNTVHDCVWFDVQDEIIDLVARETKVIMESVPELLESLYGMKVPVPFPVEVEVGKNLYDKKVLHI